ncbi:hypothetical protein PLICRDRAFT_171290 [Plicaturopsis crispa FD-325 SS-3]|nr:hypothetical protein PLICRDRAFT_171290 [Plicaturopsis crispa FD-325 SS-3]
MSESHPNLASSLSLAGSASSSATHRPLKRRLTSTPELTFFTPAAATFNPAPYTSNSSSHKASINLRTHSVPSVPPHIAAMDPSPFDENALFLHPPFTSFPNSHLYEDGLCYAVMAANPDWFLDASDFVSTLSSKPNAIPYPPQLEPPRGWCPAKKKDLRERGPDGWPEGEEPRLRCTFCRRTYAGVNAKSMWRRHVFEKHKIAMANRREGSDRARGRGSNKENRLSSRDHRDSRDRSESVEAPSDPLPTHRSRYNPSRSAEASTSTRRSSRTDKFDTPSAPMIQQKEFSPIENTKSHPLAQSTLPASPPLTPARVPRSPELTNLPQSFDMSASPLRYHPFVPPSPYDPTATPTFRHSSPRLPSEQPWRFPSPSHPLHSRARELSLSMLVRGAASPAIKFPSTIYASPASMERSSGSVLSPSVPLFRRFEGSSSTSNSSPDSLLKTPVLVRDSPRTLFSKGQIPVPITERMGKGSVEESPLSHTSRQNAHTRKVSDLRYAFNSSKSNSWLQDSPVRTPSKLAGPIRLQGDTEDPFTGMYNLWVDSREGGEATPAKVKETGSSAGSSDEAESPVLRSSKLPEGDVVGLGIGLMEPFSLGAKGTMDAVMRDDSSDYDGELLYPPLDDSDEAEVDRALSVPPTTYQDQHMSGPDEAEEARPPTKRRRTINGRI